MGHLGGSQAKIKIDHCMNLFDFKKVGSHGIKKENIVYCEKHKNKGRRIGLNRSEIPFGCPDCWLAYVFYQNKFQPKNLLHKTYINHKINKVLDNGQERLVDVEINFKFSNSEVAALERYWFMMCKKNEVARKKITKRIIAGLLKEHIEQWLANIQKDFVSGKI